MCSSVQLCDYSRRGGPASREFWGIFQIGLEVFAGQGDVIPNMYIYVHIVLTGMRGGVWRVVGTEEGVKRLGISCWLLFAG
jgi:hypothetical protein